MIKQNENLKDEIKSEERQAQKSMRELGERLRENAVITFKDIDEIERLFSKLDRDIRELTKSRERWKTAYFELKSKFDKLKNTDGK